MYEYMTRYLDELCYFHGEDDSYAPDRRYLGTSDFIDDANRLASDVHYVDYCEVLEKHGRERSSRALSSVDVTDADLTLVIALIVVSTKELHFCGGSMNKYVRSGALKRWLLRLKELDR